MHQYVKTFFTFPDTGKRHVNVDDKINAFLHKNPDFKIRSVYNVNIDKIGGRDAALLVVFETDTPQNPVE